MFKDRNPKYNSFKSLKGGIFPLEGIIGVGKSTTGISIVDFLNNIGINAKFFPEYVNKELLDQYISDMKKYAYTFQMVMLCKRIEIYRDAERFAATGGVAIIDRSITGDFVFATMQHSLGNITDQEFEAYKSLMKQEIQLIPTVTIYLKCSADVSLCRVKNRGIQSEIEGYNFSYMKNLENAYDKVMNSDSIGKCITIDWNISVQIVNGRLLDEMVQDILERL